MANHIHKKTIVGGLLELFGYVKEKPMMRSEGKPLHINPPFESRQRLKRAISRLRICKNKISGMKLGDPARRSWEMEMLRREQEIERFGGGIN